MKPARVVSDSSTTSDNTSEFIELVKKHDVVYNTHNPDYKNVEVKMKVWSQIAEEMGLSVEASKRKWKNLRDSYTKYLRSFRIGTKTSKKYQYWAHAEHMDFLKPYQGPGRNTTNPVNKPKEEDDSECDWGYQVLTKATTSSDADDLKVTIGLNAPSTTTAAAAAQAISTSNAVTAAFAAAAAAAGIITTSAATATTAPIVSSAGQVGLLGAGVYSSTPNGIVHTTPTATTTSSAGGATVMLPVPSLPTVPLPPQLTAGKPLMTPLPSTMTPQIFSLPPLPNTVKTGSMPMVASSTASSVGCLILEPQQLFAVADAFKKADITVTPALGLMQNTLPNPIGSTVPNKTNPPLITKIRRVQPSPQTSAINLSFNSASNAINSNSNNNNNNSNTNINNNNNNHHNQLQPPPAKIRKALNERSAEIDVAAILQANRDLDANTLFFLSLARTVRSMPTKLQSLAKMRCMRIVSDLELEFDSLNDGNDDGNLKYSIGDSPPPPPPEGTITHMPNNAVNEAAATEHFVYVMSPSRVESMIDISSDEEATVNGN